MAGRPDTPAAGQQTDAAGVQSQPPLELSGVFATGATFHGRPVSEMTIRYRGGETTLELGDADGSTPDDEPVEEVTEMEAAILQVVTRAKPGEVLSNDRIAEKSGYANSDGLRNFVRKLAAVGLLKKVRHGWLKL